MNRRVLAGALLVWGLVGSLAAAALAAAARPARPPAPSRQWAGGVVPTPHGPIRVRWRLVAGGPVVSVTAPTGTRRVR